MLLDDGLKYNDKLWADDIFPSPMNTGEEEIVN
jgi:hypothetical protein